MNVGELIAKLVSLREKGIITNETKVSVPAQPDQDYDRTSDIKIIKDGKNGIIICDVNDSVFKLKNL